MYRDRAGALNIPAPGCLRGLSCRAPEGLKPDGYGLGHAGLLHGHAVERVDHLHGALTVCDEDELAYGRHLLDEAVELVYVGVVERGVDLVQEAERARLYEEDGEYERDGRKRLFAAGEEHDALKPLSGGLRDYVDARLQHVLALGEPELCPPAVEEPREVHLELLVYLLEGVLEFFAGRPVYPQDRGVERVHGLLQVGLLGDEELVPALELLVLLERRAAHLSHGG